MAKSIALTTTGAMIGELQKSDVGLLKKNEAHNSYVPEEQMSAHKKINWFADSDLQNEGEIEDSDNEE